MGLPIPYCTSFCCCCGLDTGTKLIAALHFVISLTIMITSSVVAEGMRQLMGTPEDLGDHIYTIWFKICVTIAVSCIVHLVLAAMLMFGVYKKKTWAIRAWVWVMCALYVAALLYVVVSLCFGTEYSGSEIFPAFIAGVIFFGVLAYCIVCANSYYMVLRSSEDMEAPQHY